MQNQTDRGNFNLKTGAQSRCLFLMLFLLIGCFSVSHALASGPRKGGTLRFGTENDFAGFDVLKSSSRIAINGSIAANTIMEPLFRLDDKNNLIPVLGLSAEKIEDGKAWIIKLRKQVAFHDGTAFNADAVVNHWRRMLNPENKFRGRSALGPVISVTKVDVHTVRFDLKHDWLPFEKVISSTRGLANLIPSNKAVES
ncbi:MAG: ABC transporter substrate-binding protein, partial [Desulfosarcinaceae bacterium]